MGRRGQMNARTTQAQPVTAKLRRNPRNKPPVAGRDMRLCPARHAAQRAPAGQRRTRLQPRRSLTPWPRPLRSSARPEAIRRGPITRAEPTIRLLPCLLFVDAADCGLPAVNALPYLLDEYSPLFFHCWRGDLEALLACAREPDLRAAPFVFHAAMGLHPRGKICALLVPANH